MAKPEILVDTSPDMREQLLAANVGRLDGVLITHDHADQLHGLDDLRVVTMNMKRRLDLWSDRRGLEGVREKFNYCFETPQGSDYPPILNAHEIAEPFADFEIAGAGGTIPVRAFGQNHGRIRSLGFRFGRIAYSPDVDGLDEAAFAALAGVGMLDRGRVAPHAPPSHAHLATHAGMDRAGQTQARHPHQHAYRHGLRHAGARTAAGRRARL